MDEFMQSKQQAYMGKLKEKGTAETQCVHSEVKSKPSRRSAERTDV